MTVAEINEVCRDRNVDLNENSCYWNGQLDEKQNKNERNLNLTSSCKQLIKLLSRPIQRNRDDHSKRDRKQAQAGFQ